MDRHIAEFIARNDSASAYPDDSRILMEALRLATGRMQSLLKISPGQSKPEQHNIESYIKLAMERVGPMTNDAHHEAEAKLLADREQLRKMYRTEPDLKLLSELTANDSLGG